MSLWACIMNVRNVPGGSVDISTSLSTPLRDAGSHSNLSQVANTPADASAGGNAGAAGAAPGLGIDVSKPPPGLPNARIFRKLNQSSVAASPSASSIAVSAPALSNPTLEASDASNAGVERNGGATVGLPSALEQHLHANGVQVSASPPGWDGHNSGQGAGKEMVGEGAASGTSGSWLESLKVSKCSADYIASCPFISNRNIYAPALCTTGTTGTRARKTWVPDWFEPTVFCDLQRGHDYGIGDLRIAVLACIAQAYTLNTRLCMWFVFACGVYVLFACLHPRVPIYGGCVLRVL